jgi:HNH endonuclease
VDSRPAAHLDNDGTTKGAFCMDRQRNSLGRFMVEYSFTDDQIKELYIDRQLSVAQVAKTLNTSPQPLYKRLRKMGLMRNFGETRKITGATRGENNPNWQGGRFIHNGYVMIWLDGEYLYEHRYIAEQKLGRKLNPGEVIHHVDGNKTNNDPENILIFASHGEHMKIHMTSEEARKRGAHENRK